MISFYLLFLALLIAFASADFTNPSFEGDGMTCSLDGWTLTDLPDPPNFASDAYASGEPAGNSGAFNAFGNTQPTQGNCAFLTEYAFSDDMLPGQKLFLSQNIGVQAPGMLSILFDWWFLGSGNGMSFNRTFSYRVWDADTNTTLAEDHFAIFIIETIVFVRNVTTEQIGPFAVDNTNVSIQFIIDVPESGNAGQFQLDFFQAVPMLPTTTPPTTTTPPVTASPTNPPVTTPPTTEEPSIEGDPHFIGFHGQKYDFHGLDNEIFNLISHPKYQLNGLFTKTFVESEDVLTYITKLGLSVVGAKNAKDELLIGCKWDSGKSIPTFVLNGEVAQFTEKTLKIAESRFVNIQRNKTDGLMEIDTPYFKTSMSFDQFHDTCFININRVSYNGNSRRLLTVDSSLVHGVLGQTVYFNGNSTSDGLQGEGIVEGAVDDYRLADFDLYGSDFRFNKYKGF